MSELLTGIAELTTHDGPTPEESTRLTDAALVVDRGRVAWLGPAAAAPAADSRTDLGGRAVLPGWVDAHTHLVFAGDRAAEFEARLAGRPYAAGGIATTVAATRAATDDELRANAARLRSEALAGGTTRIETKTGYGLDVETEVRLARIGREVADSVTYLGAHLVPPGRRPPRLPRPRRRPHAAGGAAVRRRDRRVLRDRRVHGRRVAGGAARRPSGRPPPPRARQPAGGVRRRRPRRGARRRQRRPRQPRVRRRRRGARRLGHDRGPAPGRRPQHPRAARARQGPRGRRRADRDREQLQPGLELHDVDGVLRRDRGPPAAPDPRGGALGGDPRRRSGAGPRRRRRDPGRRPGRPARARCPDRGAPRLPARGSRSRTGWWSASAEAAGGMLLPCPP